MHKFYPKRGGGGGRRCSILPLLRGKQQEEVQPEFTATIITIIVRGAM